MTAPDTSPCPPAPADFDPVAYINDPDWHTSSLGLHRIDELLQRLGRPQDRLRFVHVAGTNGKGSTCAFTASVLVQAGYRTGMFTSPYVVEFAERIQVDGVNIAPDQLREATLLVREQAEAMSEHPTEFELMTAVAFVHFASQGCDIVVLEVGLGGRLDSTNIIGAPDVCAICPIALDHTDILGDSLAAIAAEKAGIIKQGATVIAGVQPPEALATIRQHAAQEGCQLVCVDTDGIQGTPRSFSYAAHGDAVEGVSLRLLGSYQVQNAALACEIAWALRERGWRIPDEALVAGLSEARWPARFELVRRNPDVIVDGGHNAQGAQALIESLEQSYPGRPVIFVMGVLADKDFPAMATQVATYPFTRTIYCAQPPSERALPAADLARMVKDVLEQRCSILEALGLPASSVQVCEAGSLDEAVKAALDEAVDAGQHAVEPNAAPVVVAFGSLYSVAAVLQAHREWMAACLNGAR